MFDISLKCATSLYTSLVLDNIKVVEKLNMAMSSVGISVKYFNISALIEDYIISLFNKLK